MAEASAGGDAWCGASAARSDALARVPSPLVFLARRSQRRGCAKPRAIAKLHGKDRAAVETAIKAAIEIRKQEAEAAMTESMNNRVYVRALEKATAALENGHGRGFPASQCRHFLKRLLQSDRPIFGNLMGADRQDLAAFLDAPAYENQNPNKEYAEGCETSTPGLKSTKVPVRLD